MTSLLKQLASDDILEDAFDWLCQARKSRADNNDVWHFRFHWGTLKPQLQAQLKAGDYHFSPLEHRVIDNEVVNSWCAQDALVLKALSLVLANVFDIDKQCFHFKGHGGLKQAVNDVALALPTHTFYMRSDVKGYYASIDHHLLMAQFSECIQERAILRLLWQYLQHTITHGGLFEDNTRGISLRCPLSPLIGAFYLKPLDKAMAALNVRYWRYMDDWIILAKSRWQLRRAIRTLTQVLPQLNLTKHPDKTQMGRCQKGITFLGYHLNLDGIGVASDSLHRSQAKLARLYEQKASREDLEQYWNHWLRWVYAGLPPHRLRYKQPSTSNDKAVLPASLSGQGLLRVAHLAALTRSLCPIEVGPPACTSLQS